MRLKIYLEAPIVPILYRHRILSLIKEALKKEGEKTEKSEFCFNLSLPADKNPKMSTIQIDENFTVEDLVFHIKPKTIGLYISSVDEDFIKILMEGAKKIKTFHFSSDKTMLVDGKKIFWKVRGAKIVEEEKIESDEVVFKTNSPILVEEEKKPILYFEEGFEKSLNRIIREKFLALVGREPKDEVKFEPIEMSKVVVKHTLKAFREKTGKPIMFLTGSKGIFRLKGHPEDLKLIYQMGLGLRTNQGFGMINTVD